MLIEDARKEIRSEIERVKEAVTSGSVLEREKYLEMMGVIQGLNLALEVITNAVRKEAHNDDDDTGDTD